MIVLIKYTTGDIFQSGAECLVNTVNCEGYIESIEKRTNVPISLYFF